MGEYNRVLNEIDEAWLDGRAAAIALPARHRLRRRERLLTPPPSAPVPATSPVPAMPAAAYGALFDNLRALANGGGVRVLVFASAAAEESARAVVDGTASHAQRLGLRVVTAAVTESGGRAVLQRPPDETSGPTSRLTPLAVDLHRPAWQSAFAEWRCAAASDADLVIIEGRPLGESIDSAVLACACDGLVIVAQAEVTARATLRLAAERSRTIGCRTLGVVMRGRGQRLTRWFRRT